MKITKRQLRRIIRNERRKLQEACGDHGPAPEAVALELPAVDVADAVGELVNESEDPAGDMLTEMEVAARSLDLVVESVQNAAQHCTNCGPEINEKAPIVEALAAQAAALQEMLEAQVDVLSESAELNLGDLSGEI